MENATQNGSRFLKWILVLGIVVVLNLFFAYAIDAFYKEPQWDKYCPTEQINIIPETKDKCVAGGGQWTEDASYAAQKPIAGDVQGRKITGYCNVNYTCQKKYDETHKVYNRNVFIALVILGVLSLIGGFVFATYEAISLGFSLGGVISLVIAAIRYWSDMDEKLRVVVLGLALVTLVYLGVKKFQN